MTVTEHVDGRGRGALRRSLLASAPRSGCDDSGRAGGRGGDQPPRAAWAASMLWQHRVMAVILEVVSENLSTRREHVYPSFKEDSRFNMSWWHGGSAKSPVSFCRFLDGDEEVGRAKILVRSGFYRGYTT